MAIQNRYRCDNCDTAGFTDQCGILPDRWTKVKHFREEYWYDGIHRYTDTYHLCPSCTRKFKKLPFVTKEKQ